MLYMVTLCNIYHQYTPNVSIYSIHGSYGYCTSFEFVHTNMLSPRLRYQASQPEWTHDNPSNYHGGDLNKEGLTSKYVIKWTDCQQSKQLLGSRTIYHCHQFDGPSEPNEEWHNYQYWQRHLQPSVKHG